MGVNFGKIDNPKPPRFINFRDLELYSDYLISLFALTTTTGLSLLLDNEYSNDQITRLISGAEHTSRDLWTTMDEPTVRAVEAKKSGILKKSTIIIEANYGEDFISGISCDT